MNNVWAVMKKIDYSDEELLRLIVKTKKVHYFEMIYDRYAPFIYNKCFWFVHEEEQAKDLTQDIFIKIYLNLSKFKGESKLSTWIYSIAGNSCIEYVRKNKNKPIRMPYDTVQIYDFIEIFDSEEPSYAELLDNNYEQLQDIMNRLPAEDKMLLLMKYQDNLPISQIVERLNVKESAVKMRLLRAKKKVLELSVNVKPERLTKTMVNTVTDITIVEN